MDREDFDVVFTDIKMPGMDGLEVTERIKARCPWTPVVVITGYGTADNEARASILGASGFVRKPLTPEIIESVTLKAVSEGEHVEQALEDTPAETTEHTEVETGVEAETTEAAEQPLTVARIARNVGLFFAAPFVALGYVIAVPFVGFYMFAKLGREAYVKRHQHQ
jgi:DNA-binding NtrC family response regulator